jgi:LPS sulfotransferase NodH
VFRFVVFADSRTGGTHLVSSLKSHPQIACVSEPFPHNKLDTHEAQVEWSNFFYADREQSGMPTVGFRLKVKQLADPEAFAAYLEDREILPLRLTRRNVVKQAVSRLRAMALFRESGDYNVKAEKKPLGATRIEAQALFNQVDELLELKRRESEFFERLAHPGKDELVYEDMLADEQAFFSDLYTRLNANPDHAPSSNVKKNTSNSLEQSILNFEELLEALRGTPYEAMLTES